MVIWIEPPASLHDRLGVGRFSARSAHCDPSSNSPVTRPRALNGGIGLTRGNDLADPPGETFRRERRRLLCARSLVVALPIRVKPDRGDCFAQEILKATLAWLAGVVMFVVAHYRARGEARMREGSRCYRHGIARSLRNRAVPHHAKHVFERTLPFTKLLLGRCQLRCRQAQRTNAHLRKSKYRSVSCFDCLPFSPRYASRRRQDVSSTILIVGIASPVKRLSAVGISHVWRASLLAKLSASMGRRHTSRFDINPRPQPLSPCYGAA